MNLKQKTPVLVYCNDDAVRILLPIFNRD